MKAEIFIQKAEKIIDKFQLLIDKMPYRGDTTEQSQKICLQQALNELSYTVNGVQNSDFKK